MFSIIHWKEEKQKHISEAYNIMWPCLLQYVKDKMINYDEIYVIHFIGPIKPWNYSLREHFEVIKDLLFDGRQYKLILYYLKYFVLLPLKLRE